MADQNLLNAINAGKKKLLDTINIEEPVDNSLVGITQNTPVGITDERLAQTKEIEKRIKKVNLLSQILRTTSIRNTTS